MTNVFSRLLVAVPATLLALGGHSVVLGGTIEEKGVIVCVNDKWDETEPEKGHKLVDYAGRCVKVPDDAATAKTTETCTGRYEYLADGSWTAKGACLAKTTGGDTVSVTWEEGSALKTYLYTATGGTGKFKDATGGGTYKYDQLTDTLFGGRYHSKLQVP